MNPALKKKLDSMSSQEIKDSVQSKSKYGVYIIKYDTPSHKRLIKEMLSQYRLYENDHLSGDDEGYVFYSPRHLVTISSGNNMPEYAVYSSGVDFIRDGQFERQYHMDDVDNHKIDYSGFEKWLDDFLGTIFGHTPSYMLSSEDRKKRFIRENMKTVKKYDEFLNEKKIPKLSINIEELLGVLKGEGNDIFRTFEINKDEVGVRDEIDKLYMNRGFNKNLKKNDLKKGKPQNTQYNETLLDDEYVLKFFFVYNKESIELEEPKFIILQYYNTKTNQKSDILGFTNSDNINSFYEKLTDATIELTKGDDTYVYQTSNGGNNWEMKNVQMEDDEMVGTFDKKELQSIIDKKKFNVKHD